MLMRQGVRSRQYRLRFLLQEPNVPASFNVMLAELRGLALDVELKKL
jgi:DNA-directed RNA polymerase beta subunit